MRSMIAAIGVIILSSASLAASQTSPAQVGVNEDQIRQMLAGNTVSGFSADDGAWYTEFFSPDGVIRGQEEGQAYKGQWTVLGSQVCVRYPKEEDPGKLGDPDCTGIATNGDHFAWTEEGGIYPAQLRSGNPDGL